MTNRNLLLAVAAGALATTGCTTPASTEGKGAGPLATTTLHAADGSVRGEAWIANGELRVMVDGLPAGPHGTHLHMTGKCDAPDFASAGGHLNPHSKAHGSDNPQGKHLGDLPNLIVGAGGKGSMTVPMPGSAAQLEAVLFDADGTAVVVHAEPDDYRTDPSGNSGGRVACGVLTQSL